MPDSAHSAQLFLCHSHSDKPFVRRLAKDLSELSVDVWLDDWELAPGDSLHDRVGNALSTVAYVGVVLSPDSVKSNWCRSEVQQGLAREKRTGSKVVIPLLHKRVATPPFLEDRLYPNFSKSYMVALAQLAAFVHQLPQRELAEGLAEERPKTLDQVKHLLESIGWKGVRYLSPEDYDTLRAILKRVGVSITEDEFDLVPRPPQPRKKAARKKGPKKKAARRKVVRKKGPKKKAARKKAKRTSRFPRRVRIKR